MNGKIAALRGEKGFGLLELLISLTILNVGLLALVSVFISGATSLRRASKTGTAGAIAEQQIELYRAMRYCQIVVTGTSAGAVTSPDSVYSSDSAYSATQATTARSNSWCTAQTPAQNPPYSACVTSLGSSPSPALSSCSVSQTITGADGHHYRVDTYVVLITGGCPSAGTCPPGNYAGREGKQVTVVVRDATTTTTVARPNLTRQVATFDPLSGS
jgi:type II secretory pathway pseudopilin PulG